MAVNNNRNQDSEQQAQIAQVSDQISDELFDLAAVFQDKGAEQSPDKVEEQAQRPDNDPDSAQTQQGQVPSDSPPQSESSDNIELDAQTEVESVQVTDDASPAQIKKEKYGDDVSLAVEDDGHDGPPHVREIDASRPTSVDREIGINDQVSRIDFDIETHIVSPPQPEVPVCLPPDGMISFEQFLDLVQDEVINQQSPFQLDTEFSVTIEISSYEQFRDAITVIDQTGFNSDSAAQEFTFFLGQNTLMFDEQVDVDFNNDTLTILGCGCTKTYIDGQEKTRILNLESGFVNVDSVTFQNGFVPNPDNPTFEDALIVANFGGGAIVVQRDVVFNSFDSCYINNEAFFGGAIANAGGLIDTIDNNLFRNNSGDAAGGAIYNAFFAGSSGFNYAQLNNILNTTFLNNRSDGFLAEAIVTEEEVQIIPQPGRGGAIANIGNLTNIIDSQFDGNVAIGEGGAVFNGVNTLLAAVLGVPSGIYQIRGSEFVHNQALNSMPIDNGIGEIVRINGEGGAIYNFENSIITIIEAAFNQNHAEHIGGALYNSGAIANNGINPGALPGIYSSFTQNSAHVLGGGIFSNGNLSNTYITSEFYSNTAGFAGGGFYAAGQVGSFDLNNPIDSAYPGIIGSTFNGNMAAAGGGLYIGNIDLDAEDFDFFMLDGFFEPVIVNENNFVDNIRYSSFINNTASVIGGAISIDGDGSVEGDETTLRLIENSTISGNTSPFGTAISATAATIELINFSTITQNIELAPFFDTGELANSDLGSTIYTVEGGSSITIGNTIVAINAGEDLVGAGYGTEGYNIIGDFGFSDYTPGPGDFTGPNVDILNLPELLALTTGFPTLLELNGLVIPAEQIGDFMYIPIFHPLAGNSAAIDMANPIWSDGLPDTDGDGLIDELFFDQRTFGRPVDGNDDADERADIGAFETDSDLVIPGPIVAPIIFDLDNDGVELISSQHSAITLQNSLGTHQLGWVSGDDGILVYDINQDGLANSIGEIALSRYHPDAITDLHGLKLAFDSNQDNVFDHMDETFAHFGVWQDINENGITEGGEFKTLVEAGIEAIELDAVEGLEWNADNIVFAEGTYVMTDGSEHIFGDVALTMDDISATDQVTFIDDGLAAEPITTADDALVEVVDPLVNFTIEESTQVELNV